MPGKFTLGGRTYVPVVRSTLEHDLHVMGTLRAAGIDELPLAPGETAEEYAVRMVGMLLAGGRGLDLIAAMIRPEEGRDEDWTLAGAAAVRAHLAGLTDEADKQQAQGLLVSVLVPFLESGLVSLKRSVTSSRSVRAGLAPERAATTAGGSRSGQGSFAGPLEETTTPR